MYRSFFLLFWHWSIICTLCFSTLAHADNSPEFNTQLPHSRAVIEPAAQHLIYISKTYPDLSQDLVSIFNSELGYTLVGAKPVSFYENGHSVNPNLISILAKEFSLSKEIIFKVVCLNAKRKELCIIHRKSFLECCKKNIKLQSFIKKHFSSAEDFLNIFQQSSLPLVRFCKYNDVAIGTMLGFGEKNASTWLRWTILRDFFGIGQVALPRSNVDPGTIAIRYLRVNIPTAPLVPKANLQFPSLYAEWNFLNKTKKSMEGPIPPLYINPPAFFYWDEQEEQILRLIKAQETLGIVLTNCGRP